MSEKSFRLSKKLVVAAVLFAVVVMLGIVFGHNTFSGDNSGRLSITEFKKGPLPPGRNDRLALKQAGSDSPKDSPPSDLNANLSKAVLNVKGLSCSSCVQNIKDALSNIQGIEDILVDIPRSTAQIYFKSNTLKDPDRLAEVITSAGYPAILVKTYSSEDLRKEEAAAAARSRYYIASVGGWDVARSDLDTQLELAKKRYEKTYGGDLFSTARGKSLIDNLRAQIVLRLIDEGVMMQEITKAGYKVAAPAVEDELKRVIQQSGKGLEEFKTDLEDNGISFEYFRKRLETQMLINRYLEERILSGATNDVDKQTLITSWFNNAKILAEVSYYDKDLERLVQEQNSGSKCGR